MRPTATPPPLVPGRRVQTTAGDARLIAEREHLDHVAGLLRDAVAASSARAEHFAELPAELAPLGTSAPRLASPQRRATLTGAV